MPYIQEMKVAFIGLGAMGNPMARRLASSLPSGARMVVYDVVETAMNAIVSAFPEIVSKASSPKDAAQQADLIISMVPEGRHVHSVYLDEKTGLATVDLSHHTLIDCSTIDMATNQEVKQRLAEKFPSVRFYDAPVSGGVLGAEKGTLAFFLGCSEDDAAYHELTEVLKTMGNQIIGCGGPSLGLATKLANNYLSGIIAIASSEALNMGMRAGLDPVILSKAFAAGTAQNTICDKFNPVPGVKPDAPSSKGYQGGFKVQLMRKDFDLAVNMAKQVGATLVLGDQGLRTYEEASNDPKCRDLDSRVVFRYLGGNEDWQNPKSQ